MHRSLRQAAILDSLNVHSCCTVNELSERLQVSNETIRRDIKALAEKGAVERVHGGAVLTEAMHEPGFRQRLTTNPEAKQTIARAAVERIHDGDTIMLDTGSTTAYVARALGAHKNLTIVTNCIEIGRSLANGRGNKVFLVGGELRADDGALFGVAAFKFVEDFRARHAILSVGGIDIKDGLMDFGPHEAEFARVLMSRADNVMVVADHSKFGRHAPVRICSIDRIDCLATDRPPPSIFAEQLESSDVSLLLPGSAATAT